MGLSDQAEEDDERPLLMLEYNRSNQSAFVAPSAYFSLSISPLVSNPIPYNVFCSHGALRKCKSLKELSLPTFLDLIEKAAFYSRTKLMMVKARLWSLQVRNSLDIMPFKSCSSLGNVQLPPTLHQLQEESLSYCNHLINLFLPEQLQIYWNQKRCGDATMCNSFGFLRKSRLFLAAHLTTVAS